eukprot:3256900-Amphidinium_carterae.1
MGRVSVRCGEAVEDHGASLSRLAVRLGCRLAPSGAQAVQWPDSGRCQSARSLKSASLPGGSMRMCPLSLLKKGRIGGWPEQWRRVRLLAPEPVPGETNLLAAPCVVGLHQRVVEHATYAI